MAVYPIASDIGQNVASDDKIIPSVDVDCMVHGVVIDDVVGDRNMVTPGQCPNLSTHRDGSDCVK